MVTGPPLSIVVSVADLRRGIDRDETASLLDGKSKTRLSFGAQLIRQQVLTGNSAKPQLPFRALNCVCNLNLQ